MSDGGLWEEKNILHFIHRPEARLNSDKDQIWPTGLGFDTCTFLSCPTRTGPNKHSCSLHRAPCSSAHPMCNNKTLTRTIPLNSLHFFYILGSRDIFTHTAAAGLHSAGFMFYLSHFAADTMDVSHWQTKRVFRSSSDWPRPYVGDIICAEQEAALIGQRRGKWETFD